MPVMNLPEAAIRTAIAEVLEGSLGTERALDAGAFIRALFYNHPRENKQAVALRNTSARHCCQVVTGEVSDNGAAPISATSDTQILNLPVTIYVLTATASVVAMSDRDAVIDALRVDLRAAARALCAAGGPLTLTADGTPTRITSGLMRGPSLGSVPSHRVTNEDWEAQFIESQINGIVIVDLIDT